MKPKIEKGGMGNDSADEQTNDRAVQSFKGQVEKEALGRNKNRS